MANENESGLVSLLRETKKVLDSHDVTFWLDCGTLLGAMRDGKFIEWERDIDLGSWDTAYRGNKKLLISDDLKKAGLKVGVYETFMNVKNECVCADIKFYHLEDDRAVEPKYTWNNVLGQLLNSVSNCFAAPYHERANEINSFSGGVVIEIFNFIAKITPMFMRRLVSGLARTVYLKFASRDLTELVPATYFSEFIDVPFYGMNVKIPAKAEDYLCYRYGEDWRTPIREWVTEKDDKSVLNYLGNS